MLHPPCLRWSINYGFRFMVCDWTACWFLPFSPNTYFTQGRNHSYVAGGVACEIQYSRELLLLFCNHKSLDYSTIIDLIPNNLRTNPKRGTTRTNWKHRCKGGISHQLKRLKNSLFLPTMLLTKTQSLKVKKDEFSANTHYLHEYWTTCVLVIIQTWWTATCPVRWSLHGSWCLGPTETPISPGRVAEVASVSSSRMSGVRQLWWEHLYTQHRAAAYLSVTVLSAQGISSNFLHSGIHTPKDYF